MTALVIHGLTIRGETETNCFHLKVTHKGGGPFKFALVDVEDGKTVLRRIDKEGLVQELTARGFEFLPQSTFVRL